MVMTISRRKRQTLGFLLISGLATYHAHAFQPVSRTSQSFAHQEMISTRHEEMPVHAPSDLNSRRDILATGAACLSSLIFSGQPAHAATKDISGQDLSGQDYSNRDFSGMIAKKTNFRNCNLQGSVFKNADLVGADFSGADVRGASFVDAVLDGTTFANAQAQKAVFSKTILDIANFENVDLTDSLWPSKLFPPKCEVLPKRANEYAFFQAICESWFVIWTKSEGRIRSQALFQRTV